jgi:hypothetical protein
MTRVHAIGERCAPRAETFLSSQLRESASYLKDAGWSETATLLLAAADEIERLRAQVAAPEADMPPSGARETKDAEFNHA